MNKDGGYGVVKRRLLGNWKVYYGLMIIRACKEADELGERTGQFIPVYPPSEEEFREAWKVLRKQGRNRGRQRHWL